MISKAGSIVVTCLVAVAVQVIAQMPAAAQDVTIRQLPQLNSDAVVAHCGDRAVILSHGVLFSVSPSGDTTRVVNVARAIAVFSEGLNCRAIDARDGIVDVSLSSTTTVARSVSGPLPDAVTSAAQAFDGSVWFGIEGTDELGAIAPDGTVRYYEFPEGDSAVGTLAQAPLQVAPSVSATPIFSRDVQLLSASKTYVWAVRESTPLNAVAYALRFDPRTLAYERVSLGEIARFAGLAALADGRAVILTLGDRILMLGSSRIVMQWNLPGEPRYHGPPFRLNMAAAVGDGVYIAAVNDARLWYLPQSGDMLTLKSVFPERPSWIFPQSGRLIGIDTDRSLFMSGPL